MPSPPPHFAAAFILTLLHLSAAQSAAHTCSNQQSETRSLCPPFTSSPPFPFSLSPGCGHPSFPTQCSSPHSIITINNLSFSLLHYDTDSSSLLLSPQPTPKSSNHTNCTSPHFLSIPNRPINLSGSPFRVSDSSCSRLSVLKPCPPPNLPNCSHCPWDCKLIKSPVQLLHGCGFRHRQVSEQGCHGDVLGFLDQFLLMGIWVEWEEDRDAYFSNCKACEANNGVCGFNSSDPEKQFVCFPSHSEMSQPWIRQHGPNRIAILCLIFVFMCLLAAVSIASVMFRSKRKSLADEPDPAILYLHRHRSASLLPPVFTYEELECSTNRFDPKRKIGDGGFGCVYLGQLYDGRIVAVKHLHNHHRPTAGAKAFSTKSFCNEILILSTITHPNLVKLHGYCSDPRGLLLVYDYVPNGTLAEHLHGTKKLYRKGSLTWQIRVDIALQTAMAIEYLHFSVVPPVVHRDITSSNIFVERDMRIKVGDFGLSRILVLPETNSTSTMTSSRCVWTGPQGTPGYLDPDYHRSFRLTEKSDVYSFGVVLLELITGMRAVDQRRERREVALADLVVSKIQMGLLNQVVDPALDVGAEVMRGVGAVAELAFRCVAADKDDRPDAREVVAELRRVRNHAGGGGGSGGVSRASSNAMSVVVPDVVV
ncbi:LEAF RUST 10 DISEASE-RESISTANCE LOCUS RECEPTOR-LIKE PROTEIN KINASE-like 1.5 [Actinidia eriantha]|uniref:LEAF RUST 10 DISEASE-RESISTANCE LOCUS RECEPTOR-LIKE PROTEIN KINASE-like 1.5 n=1 Tax=Actinidia eriantha TaxID=165200 RepID=UPI00258F23CD|nr:LEAF RUST 10 DISEASE-RESISTANCE LOCUS RECEPTOR-LIKE PROTEIN KINASE-like 1.5 [Actinidia eriantha]